MLSSVPTHVVFVEQELGTSTALTSPSLEPGWEGLGGAAPSTASQWG